MRWAHGTVRRAQDEEAQERASDESGCQGKSTRPAGGRVVSRRQLRRSATERGWVLVQVASGRHNDGAGCWLAYAPSAGMSCVPSSCSKGALTLSTACSTLADKRRVGVRSDRGLDAPDGVAGSWKCGAAVASQASCLFRAFFNPRASSRSPGTVGAVWTASICLSHPCLSQRRRLMQHIKLTLLLAQRWPCLPPLCRTSVGASARPCACWAAT